MNATKKKIVVSGMQPSGRVHVGNWAGAFRHWLELQDNPNYECLFFVADWHSLSEEYDPKTKRAQIEELMTDYLAVGLNPDKCTLFLQSDIMEHAELCWIFNTLTPVSFLERMTQFKDKAARQAKNINMGLLDYPVLQAADILMYKADLVPVGQDQIQHVELTRDVAGFFNRKYGVPYFPEPKPLLTETPKLMSLTDPLKKMSKSLGEKSYVAMSDDPDVILAKLKRAVTETTGVLKLSEKQVAERLAELSGKQSEDEELRGQAGVWNLLALLRLFGEPGEAKKVLDSQPIKYGELKKLVAQRIAENFADFRIKRAKFTAKYRDVSEIFARGAEKARIRAGQTMEEVRKMTGIK